jgi:hypothetical protein
MGVLHATEKTRKYKAALGHAMETFAGKTRTATAKLNANEVYTIVGHSCCKSLMKARYRQFVNKASFAHLKQKTKGIMTL